MRRSIGSFVFVLAALLSSCVAVGADSKSKPETLAPAKPKTAASVKPRNTPPVDAKTLHHKVLCGYQGWFRCPGDGGNVGWRHWSRNPESVSVDSLTFEMWPDLEEFQLDELCAVPGFMHADGRRAALFSSTHPKTVERHFQWMRQYGIDGVVLQRFLTDLRSSPQGANQVLMNVRQSAARNGRVYAVAYDMSGYPEAELFESLVRDWKALVDQLRVTRDHRYLHHGKKPVVMLWGFYSDRFNATTANRILDFFQKDPRYGAVVIGGCQWWWNKETDPEWSAVFRRFDVISPWNTGNYEMVGEQKHASTSYWKDDAAEATKAGMKYLPVVYPGFGWTNLKGGAEANDIPRLGGEFFWRQFSTAAELGVDMAYVAMFDEVDEGTAVFKVSGTPPKPGRFLTYEGLPTDWYLRLTGEGTKLIRGEIPNQLTIPIKP